MDKLPTIETGLYKHFKGGMYNVIGVGRHSETLEPIVAYTHLGEDDLWFRPYKMFTEIVYANVQRFTKI